MAFDLPLSSFYLETKVLYWMETVNNDYWLFYKIHLQCKCALISTQFLKD